MAAAQGALGCIAPATRSEPKVAVLDLVVSSRTHTAFRFGALQCQSMSMVLFQHSSGDLPFIQLHLVFALSGCRHQQFEKFGSKHLHSILEWCRHCQTPLQCLQSPSRIMQGRSSRYKNCEFSEGRFCILRSLPKLDRPCQKLKTLNLRVFVRETPSLHPKEFPKSSCQRNVKRFLPPFFRSPDLEDSN